MQTGATGHNVLLKMSQREGITKSARVYTHMEHAHM
jgi:hypothetical protein